jgi:polar amino acid transport system substrate-binding protein
MAPFDKLSTTRREAMKTGLAAIAASGGLLGRVRVALAEDTLSEIKKRGELATATEMQFPPFDISDNGVYKGVDRDLIDAVGKELGVKVSYLDLPWTSVLPGLEAKKFDLCIAPVTITKERVKRYAFTVPIADATAALMKRAKDSSIMKPEDIAGKTVGGQKGTSQVEQLKAFAAKLTKPVEVKEYVDNNQSYADLAAGRIDASVNSLPNLAYAAAQRSDTFAVVLPAFGQPTYFSWVARLDDKSLVDAINAAIIKVEADGTMAKIQQQWFGQTMDLPKTAPEPSI